ncbi:MAG TPA: hypothetical protein VH062_19285 [Polyangiaceae bacterium]|jgi:hypothetical protein|nr:hypothetical protein [Polyangiaceae bacterium]
MHSTQPGTKASSSRRRPRGAFKLAVVALLSIVGAGFGVTACLNRPLCDKDCRPKTTNIFVDSVQQNSVDKIDLLFMIDNSISMADKQAVLKAAVPDLVRRLVSPNCVDPDSGQPGTTPADPAAQCASPLIREFTPIRNIHVGIISSSIGGHGADLCKGNDASGVISDQEENDHGYLIGVRPRYATALPAGGYPADPQGFLNWNPIADTKETPDAFATTFAYMVGAVGEFGCGLESQLESMYRFLVDPNPYQQITTQACPTQPSEKCAVPSGQDKNLLAQRAAFLRHDSLVAIIMMTDENDCSIQESGQYYYAARNDIVLPHGSSVCATNPNDKCCYFCGASPPAGCAADPTCSTATVPSSDQPNLRCFHQLQRFGYDFLYPTARYVNAFSQTQICTSRPDLAPDQSNCKDLDGDKKPDLFDNPLFVGLTPAVPRQQNLVFLAGIVGVPYQDIQATDKPSAGTTATPYPANELHFKTAAQLTADGTWDTILGNDNPGNNAPPVLPTDALMTESKDPRGGMDGENPPQPLQPTSAGYNAQPVNGHEWVNVDQSDLQFACIFPLAATRDCAAIAMQNPQPGCDCKPNDVAMNNLSPLCQNAQGQYTSTQLAAKAYPGLRELQVLKDYGNNSIVASICAKNLKDDTAQDYGYRPAVDAIVDRLKEALTGKCLPRTLTVDPVTHDIPCSIIEVRQVTGTKPSCEATPGRSTPNSAVIKPVEARLQQTGVCGVTGKPDCDQSFYYCAINEAKGDDCHKAQSPMETGWCYVDPATQPGDDPSLVANCDATSKRIIRFIDPNNATPAHDATVLIACFGSQIPEDSTNM